jgi:hypothetical protein
LVDSARPSDTASAAAKSGSRQRGRTSASAVATVQIAWECPDGKECIVNWVSKGEKP